MYEFYVNMVRRADGNVYSDLHKTDERIYFTPTEAQEVIDNSPEKAHRHVVKLIAMTEEDLEYLKKNLS